MSTHLPELVIGALPFSFGNWFVKQDDNWTDWREDMPQDYWIEIDYATPEDDDGKHSGRVRLTGPDLIAAAEKIKRGEVSLGGDYVNDIVLALDDPDESNLDAIGADAVLQTAIYGTIIYG